MTVNWYTLRRVVIIPLQLISVSILALIVLRSAIKLDLVRNASAEISDKQRYILIAIRISILLVALSALFNELFGLYTIMQQKSASCHIQKLQIYLCIEQLLALGFLIQAIIITSFFLHYCTLFVCAQSIVCVGVLQLWHLQVITGYGITGAVYSIDGTRVRRMVTIRQRRSSDDDQNELQSVKHNQSSTPSTTAVVVVNNDDGDSDGDENKLNVAH